MACVLFDVDGTLFDKPGTEVRFIGFLMRRGKLGPIQLAAALWFYLRWVFRFRADVARKNKAYLTGLSYEEIKELAERFVEQELLPRMRPIILERIRNHRELGDHVTLLTGTPDFIAAPLARRVGAVNWRATRCAQHSGRFTASPPLEHPLGEAKVAYARQLCREQGTDLGQAIAYADSIHDVPLFRAVHRAVAVTPDKALARIARAEGWETIPSPEGISCTKLQNERSSGP